MNKRLLGLMLIAALFILTQTPGPILGVLQSSWTPPFGLASAASATTVTLTLNPSPGSVVVGPSNYFSVTYTNSTGKTVTAEYTGSPLSFSIQPGSTVTVSAESSGSTATEMWCFAVSSGACVQLSFTPPSSDTTYSASYYYYDLLNLSVKYSVVGGGTGYSDPQVTYVTAPSTPSAQNQPVTVTAALETTPIAFLAIRGSTLQAPATLPGSGSIQRWATNVTSWTIGTSQPSAGNITYYNQYLAYLTPSLSYGGFASNNQVKVIYRAYGGLTSSTLTGPATVWVDAGGTLAWYAATIGSNSNTQYSATLFTYGLDGYWPLSEGSGTTVVDLSANSNNGRTVNSPVWVQSPSCLLGVCLDLNGVNQYVVVGSNNIPVGSSSFTKAVWVYLPNGLDSQEENRVILCWGSTGYIGGQNCLLTGSSPGQLVNTFGGGDSLIWSASNVVDGWNLIVVTYNGTVEDAYVNGALEASTKPYAPFVQSSQVYIGGGFPGYGYFDHPIQEVRVYGYAWTQSQVSEYYALTIPRLESTVTYPGQSFTVKYYTEYRESSWYNVVGGGSPTPPTMSFYLLGNKFDVTLSLAPTTIWMDAGTVYSVTNPIGSSSPDQRWATNQTVFQAPSSHVVHLYYFNQYLVEASYTVLGGGTGYGSPSFNYTYLGTPQTLVLGANVTKVWVDNSTEWQVDALLPGSGSTQRWLGDFTPSGLVTGPLSLDLTYYHQYSVTFTYTVKGGGTGYSAPQVVYHYLGANTSTAVGVSVWVDAGSPYVYVNPLQGSSSTERWYTFMASGQIVSAGTVTVVYYHQFLLTLTYSVVYGGTPPSPTINVTEEGYATTVAIAQSGSAAWVDAGTAYIAPSVLFNPSAPNQERWVNLTSTSGTVDSASHVNLIYVHQYYVELEVNVPGSGSVSPASGWYNATSTITISAAPQAGWRFEGWSGVGAASYTGNQTPWAISVTSPLTDTAVFYPGVDISVATGGSVTYTYQGGSGTVGGGSKAVVYVQPGATITLVEKPTPIIYLAEGFTYNGATLPSNTTITVTKPISVSADFAPNYPAIIVIGLIVVVLVIVATMAVISRRQPRPAA